MPYKILTYEQIDRTAWTELVKTSATGTWFQTPEAYDFFASMPDLFQLFVVGVADNPSIHQSSNPSLQTLRAVCCGYVTKERSALKQFFTCRAIIIGGPCFADDATDEEVEALMTAVKNLSFSHSLIHSFTHSLIHSFIHSPIYIETRNFNDYSRWKGAFEKAGFSYQPHLNFHVDCSDTSKMWERLSENRKRQIRKHPSQTLSGVDESKIREWYQVLKELYRTKVKTPLWPLDFFLEAYRQGIGQFIMTQYDGKVIGGSMVVTDGKCVYEWFECGLNGEYKEQYPSVMATWDGLQWAHESGCHRYDMMGAGEPGVPYGVRDFKSEFGGTLVEHGRFLYVCKPLLYKIGAVGVKILKIFKSEGL